MFDKALTKNDDKDLLTAAIAFANLELALFIPLTIVCVYARNHLSP